SIVSINESIVLPNLQRIESRFAMPSAMMTIVTKLTDKRVISANWAKVEDISRLLKSLPNWLSLREHHRYCGEFVTRGEPLSSVNVGGSGGGDESSIPSVTIGIHPNRCHLINHQISFDGSPEEVHLRNMRETGIFSTNLNKVILLWQSGQLEQLARGDHLVSSIVSMREHDIANIMLSGNNVDLSIGMESYRNLPEVYIVTHSSCSLTHSHWQKISPIWPKCAICCLNDLEVRIHRFYHLQTLDESFFTTYLDSSSSDQRVHALAGLFHYVIPLLDDLHKQLR
ncbi:hypothetical protein RDWZM_010318, partial [Blomia tropicalis]